MGSKTKMHFKNLAEVHAARHAERSQDYIDRSAIRHIWHIFCRQYPRDHYFVAMATGKLIANTDITQLCYLYMNSFQNARVKFVAFLARKYLYRNNTSSLPTFHALGSIFDIASFLAKERAE